MFSATISGVVKRILHDNEKDGTKAFIKVVVETRKQYTKDGDMPNIYPVVALFGNDADYFRQYGGEGHWIECQNCDMDVWRGEDGDEDERISFKCGRMALLPKKFTEALDEAGVLDVSDDDDKKKKKKSGDKDKKKSGSNSKDKDKNKSRSERRKSRDEDDEDDDDDEDDEDEDEKPARKKSKNKDKPKDKKKPTKDDKTKKKKKPVDDDDDFDDDDDDDEDFDDED